MKFRHEENVRTKSNKPTVQCLKSKKSITQLERRLPFLLSNSCKDNNIISSIQNNPSFSCQHPLAHCKGLGPILFVV